MAYAPSFLWIQETEEEEEEVDGVRILPSYVDVTSNILTSVHLGVRLVIIIIVSKDCLPVVNDCDKRSVVELVNLECCCRGHNMHVHRVARSMCYPLISFSKFS